MDGEPLRRNKRQKKIVTYSGSIEAQRHASYERVAVVTRSGAVKHQHIAQNLAPPLPASIPGNEQVHEPLEDHQETALPGFDPDDVLAGIPIDRQRKPGKVSNRNYCHGQVSS